MKLPDLLLLIFAFVLLPMTVFSQDTLSLSPVSRLDARDILLLENNRLIVSKTCSVEDDIYHYVDSLFVYDVSNPADPVIIDNGFHVESPDIWGMWEYYSDWFTDAVIVDSTIITCRTHFGSLGDVSPITLIDGPVDMLSRRIGEAEFLWEIPIHERIEQEVELELEDPDYVDYYHPGQMLLYENYLIFAAGTDGVRIYDLFEPEAPFLVFILDYTTRNIHLVGGRLLIAENNNLILYDIHDPEMPERLGELRLRTEDMPYCYSKDMPVTDGLLYLPNYRSLHPEPSLLVLDLLSEESPVEVGRIEWDAEYDYFLFQVVDDRLFIRSGNTIDCYFLSEDFNVDYEFSFTVEQRNFQQFKVYGDLLFVSYIRCEGHYTYIYDLNELDAPGMEGDRQPLTFSLFSAYPNPFNSSTRITCFLPYQSHVSLGIYNIRGQVVDVLVDGVIAAGGHEVVWDGGGLGAGVYFVRMVDGRGNLVGNTQKLLLIK